MKELDCIFLVFGKTANKDFSNVKTINTKVIPNKEDIITFRGGKYKVNERFIDYSQVEAYDLEDFERGGECVYLFLSAI